MKYIETKIKQSKAKDIKSTAKHQAIKALGELNTFRIVWELLKRHKLAIVALTLISENAFIASRYL